MDEIEKYLKEHAAQFEDELCALLRIPSISAEPDHQADMQRAAEWVAERFTELGLATELIAGKWRLKPLHKRIMTSAVYMQDSAVDAERLAADPQNALY